MKKVVLILITLVMMISVIFAQPVKAESDVLLVQQYVNVLSPISSSDLGRSDLITAVENFKVYAAVDQQKYASVCDLNNSMKKELETERRREYVVCGCAIVLSISVAGGAMYAIYKLSVR